jgi:hypothetical protein
MRKVAKRLAIIGLQLSLCFILTQYWPASRVHAQSNCGDCNSDDDLCEDACTLGAADGTCVGSCESDCLSDCSDAWGSCDETCGSNLPDARCQWRCSITDMKCVAAANPLNQTQLNTCQTNYSYCDIGCVGE